jgi:hypothetical protein
MRAEGQAHIDRIEASLALVRKFLDWDRAVRRLDELNARVEDPKLWDDPKKAEEVMRERRRLEAAIGTVNQIGQEMADAIEFVELGEMEDDEATINEGLATLAALAERADNDKVQACWPARPTPTTPISKSTPAPAAPKARTGRKCSSACTRAGPNGMATRSIWSTITRAKPPASSRPRC